MPNTTLDYTIEGDDFQHVVVRLEPGHAVRAEPGFRVMVAARGSKGEHKRGGDLIGGLLGGDWS